MPEQREKKTLDSEPELKEAPTEAGTSTREDQVFSSYSTVHLHLITEAEVNDLVWDLDLPKMKPQQLGTRFQPSKQKGVKVSLYRKGQSNIYSTFLWMAIWCTAKTSVC